MIRLPPYVSLKKISRAVFVRTFAFSLAAETSLQQLSHDATEALGREVEEEEVLQAFLEYAAMPDHEWLRETLINFMKKNQGQ